MREITWENTVTCFAHRDGHRSALHYRNARKTKQGLLTCNSLLIVLGVPPAHYPPAGDGTYRVIRASANAHDAAPDVAQKGVVGGCEAGGCSAQPELKEAEGPSRASREADKDGGRENGGVLIC